jgi:septal ring factor EnvC (AmiA/AmiB activator)
MPRKLVSGISAVALGLAAATLTVPSSLLATLSPSDKVATFGLEPELARLEGVREQLARRQAQRSALQDRVAALADEIATLQSQHDATSAKLRSARDEVALLERRLDRLVPRLLARSAALRERREQVARVLADFATASRQVELDQATRARMLAISPLMLRRLRDAEERLAVLEDVPDPALARKHEIERRVPELLADEKRLQHVQEQTAQQRAALEARLAQLSGEVARLDVEQQALAGRLLSSEAAHVARAGPKADQPALPEPASRGGDLTLDAAVKGELRGERRLAFTAEAFQPASPQLIATAPKSLDLPQALAATRAGLATLPPPAKPLDASLKGALGAGEAQRLDIVFLEPAPLADARSRVPPARLRRSQAPIMPVPGEVVNPFSDQGGASTKPGITIAAAPGQAVAAPEDGRVVFAGAFRSYGQLLIIEHQREYHTLLWGFSELDVAKGDQVQTGQIVGVMAIDAEAVPELHVELRRNGRPVNPLPWLAANTNKVRG